MGKYVLVAMVFALLAAFSPVATSSADAQVDIIEVETGQWVEVDTWEEYRMVRLCAALAAIQDAANGARLPGEIRNQKLDNVELGAYRGLNCDQVLAEAGLQ